MKRGEFSARTVIGGDPTLNVNEVGIPDCIATNVTIPETVNVYNIKRLTKLVNNNEATYVEITDPITKAISKINLTYALYTPGTKIKYGDKIFRDDKEIKH